MDGIPLVFVGTLAFLSIGLLVGSFAKTPEAASAIANFIVLPMAFLSGAFFPLQGAPAWLQTISQALPLRHMVDGMLDVMVRGQPPGVLPQLGILLGFAIVVSGSRSSCSGGKTPDAAFPALRGLPAPCGLIPPRSPQLRGCCGVDPRPTPQHSRSWVDLAV